MDKEDIRLMIGNVKFSARAVAVLEHNDKILFQKRKTDANWALPGGAIATLEQGSEVVLRELEEETGESHCQVIRPLWFTEYFFKFDDIINHQYILGYLVNAPENSILYSKEEFDGIEEGKNIVYKWIDKKDIHTSNIKPEFLKKKLTKIKKRYEFIQENDI